MRVLVQAMIRASLTRARLAIPALMKMAREAKRFLFQNSMSVVITAAVSATIGLCCYIARRIIAAHTAKCAAKSATGITVEWLRRIAHLILRKSLLIESTNA
jgi:hypothetical protein